MKIQFYKFDLLLDFFIFIYTEKNCFIEKILVYDLWVLRNIPTRNRNNNLGKF